VRGLMATEKLARKIADIGFQEFRRQLEYKARLYGTELVTASRWFPSSKICSACGRISEELPLSIREWTCACGTFHDRDINAAGNLRRYALDRASCARINACTGRLWRRSYGQRETSLAEAGISHVSFGHGLSNGSSNSTASHGL
jgi:putative transposase